MQTDIGVNYHERDYEKACIPTVSFQNSIFDAGTPHEWGVLTISIRQPDSGLIEYKYFLHGPDWQAKSAAIRSAFRNATVLPMT